MTSNPPDVRPVVARAPKAAARPRELGELEKWAYPAWLDDDCATGGPSYLGYVMVISVGALLVELALLAVVVIAVG